jgi:transposase
MASKSKPDAKEKALKEHASLNPHPQAVVDPLFGSSDFFDPRDIVQVKYEMVRRVHVDGRSITESAAAFGFSRPSFYQAQAALEREGLPGLIPQKRGPRGAHKLDEEVMSYVAQLLVDDPSLTASILAEHIVERFGRRVHPRSVERALARRKKKAQ